VAKSVEYGRSFHARRRLALDISGVGT